MRCRTAVPRTSLPSPARVAEREASLLDLRLHALEPGLGNDELSPRHIDLFGGGASLSRGRTLLGAAVHRLSACLIELLDRDGRRHRVRKPAIPGEVAVGVGGLRRRAGSGRLRLLIVRFARAYKGTVIDTMDSGLITVRYAAINNKTVSRELGISVPLLNALRKIWCFPRQRA